MNKRVGIGVVMVVSGAVALGLWSVPREGSARWHQREYAGIVKELEGKTISQRMSVLWGKIRGKPARRLHFKQHQQLQQQLEEHRRALVKAGYFVERRFGITNRDARVLNSLMARRWSTNMPREQTYYTWVVGPRGPDTLIVCGRPEDMPFWEDAIRKADVPNSQ